MPELPEVETIVRGLQGPLVGRTFAYVKVMWPKSIKTPGKELVEYLPGQKITELSRRGKYLQFGLSGGRTLFLHLKMSGSLYVEPTSSQLSPYIRTIFGLDNKYELRFKDVRKFGCVYLVQNPDDVIGKLGPDPLDDNFTFAKFSELFNKRKSRLKPLLLNQEFIAGLGNIYADESCFCAGIDPRRQVNTLSDSELRYLYNSIRQSLEHGIMFKGASFDQVYPGGQYQNHFKVYGRTNKPCYDCRRLIRRYILGGRSTHICESCQK